MLRHNCGLCVAHSLHDAYKFIKSLQHRGREAAGIAAISHERIDVLKWAGTVDRFDTGDLHHLFNDPYHTFMAHVRYATKGRKDRILEDAHPVTIGGKEEKRDGHIIIRNCEIAGVHNGQVPEAYLESNISGLRTDVDTEKLLYMYRNFGERALLEKVPGAYTLAIADINKKDTIVLRDRTGIRPGSLGWKDGKYLVASEDVAFQENGAEFIEDLDLGSIYYLAADGRYRKEKVVQPKVQYCFFEYNYLANVLSSLNEVSVNVIRKRLGEKLAQEFRPPDVDFVTYMPRCPRPAAISYADSIGKPFFDVFYKPKAERAFLGSTPKERKESIEHNLWLLPQIKDSLEGKRVVCIDDSIVRGNNSRRAKELFYEEGRVKEAYLAVYTPPLGIIGADGISRGCMFGVDMSPEDNFIARGRDVAQISREMGMSVYYLSLEGMLEVFEQAGIQRSKLCTYCLGGNHPFS